MAKPKRKKVAKTATKKSSKAKKVAKPTKAKPKAKPQPKRATPAQRVRPGGGQRPTAPTKGATKAKSTEFLGGVKRAAPQLHPPRPKRRRAALSKHPDAVRARKYRRERRAVEDALELERQRRLELRRARDRQRREAARAKAQGRPAVADRGLAVRWLERVRDDFAGEVPTTLDLVPAPSGGGAVWIATGLFTFLESLSYAELGAALIRVLEDDVLIAWVDPARLARIQIIFRDPHDRSGKAGSVISKIGGFEFALGDLLQEILGGRDDDPDSLANRYEDTTVGEVYVSFAATVIKYETRIPTMSPTMTIPTNYTKG